MIKAKIIADSIAATNGKRITTFELEYPRFIHSELMTHRVFSRNAASSRAIPIDKMIDMVENSPAMPVEWGLNQAGMQAKATHKEQATCEWAWRKAANKACESARELQALGLHKQIVNRVLEPFQIMKTIVTATEFDNFFWLRCHTDAQPEIHVLADLMYKEYKESTPQTLEVGEWHLPYIKTIKSDEDIAYYSEWNSSCISSKRLTLEEAQKISASCSAQVSYRRLDDSLDKALKIYNQLVTMSPVHASPMEHLATPMYEMNEDCAFLYVQDPTDEIFEGITHYKGDTEEFYSGNFNGWIQYRQLIKGNTCWDYKGD